MQKARYRRPSICKTARLRQSTPATLRLAQDKLWDTAKATPIPTRGPTTKWSSSICPSHSAVSADKYGAFAGYQAVQVDVPHGNEAEVEALKDRFISERLQGRNS